MGTLEANWGSGNNGMLFQACTIGGASCSVGPNHYAFKNLEMRFLAGSNTPQAFLVNLNDDDTTGNSGSSHIWFIQDFIHADATDAGPGNNLVSAFVNFTSASYAGLAYDYMDECASNGNESHAWTAAWSSGPLKIAHNWIEGCSINYITGGHAGTLSPYANVYYLEIRGNRFTKPASWMTIVCAGLGL